MCDDENYSEGQALTDWLDAFYEDDEHDSESREMKREVDRNSLISRYKNQYDKNKATKVGCEIICPVCRKKFIKGTYQQVFCVNGKKHLCKDRYWNTVSDERRFRAEIFNR